MTLRSSIPMSLAAPHPGSGDMFDGIARRYDLLNRLMSLGLDRGWRRRAVRALAARRGGRFLDLATGTADMALEIVRQAPGARVVGLDPSAGMLEIGRRKVAEAGAGEAVELQVGRAESLAAADGTFDGVCIAFGIRNVPDRDAALMEMARVTRPGGRVAILEASEPRRGPLAALARFHMHHVVPRFGAWLSGAREYRYLQTSIEAFPAPQGFAAQMARCGLEVLEVRPLTFGVCCLFVARPAENKEDER